MPKIISLHIVSDIVPLPPPLHLSWGSTVDVCALSDCLPPMSPASGKALVLVIYAGERIFDFFTPGEIGHHLVLFTYSMLFVCFIVFFYMVGAYPFYVYLTDPSIATCIGAPNSPKARTLFVHWMFPRVSSFFQEVFRTWTAIVECRYVVH